MVKESEKNMGKILKVREVGEPILEKECDEVDIKNIDKAILDIIEDLKSTLEFGTGLGISAPQIGVNKRIIIVNIGFNNIVMFNPVIVAKDGPYNTVEGCLSLPGQRNTIRYQHIEIEYEDYSFTKKRIKLSGYFAQIAQHEIDHLEGILI